MEHNYEVKQPHSQPSITVWELGMRLGKGGSGGGSGGGAVECGGGYS